MSNLDFDIENKGSNYLDEKELFILYYLLRHKRISTLWSGAFIPNPKKVLVRPDSTPEDLFNRITYRGQSVLVFNYLVNLGKTLDEDGYSIYCNADYALVEGGFLTDDFHKEMYSYLELSEEERKQDNVLSAEQKDFLEDIISGKLDLKDLNTSVQFTRLANSPIECYREAILNKNADPEFIELVNKLITDYDGGRWDTAEAEKILELWYRKNKVIKVSKDEGIFYENHQKKLARLIFENVDIQLHIKDTTKLDAYLEKYLTNFQNNQLDGLSQNGLTKSFFNTGLERPLHSKYYGYEKQKEILFSHLNDLYTEYRRSDLEVGSPFVEPEYIGDAEDSQLVVRTVSKEAELFLFVHTLLCLEKEAQVTIKDFSYGTTEMFDMYDRGFMFKIYYKPSTETRDTVRNNQIFLDEEKSLFVVNGKAIKVKKFGDAYYSLKIILTEPEKEWFFSEVSEIYDISANYPDKKFYNAFYHLSNKLRTIGVDDLFETTRQSVKINKKYLS